MSDTAGHVTGIFSMSLISFCICISMVVQFPLFMYIDGCSFTVRSIDCESSVTRYAYTSHTHYTVTTEVMGAF